MNSARWQKIVCLSLAVVLLLAAARLQGELNRRRSDPALGLNRLTPLENAPPVLAFTTVALGGFRGLISNALWIRANELQEEGKYFEKVQLADWITKLEPHFSQVWIVQAWDMAYNISVKFVDHNDRWRWVQRGIELLRDEGLRYNPGDALMYRELAWFFQHKMGQNMDDAHWLYKREWALAMTKVLGSGRPDFAELIHPQTEDAHRRSRQLQEQFKIDPTRLQAVDTLYGPLDWRLPDAHAIYWASIGLEKSKKKDQASLRRMIYQSMMFSTLRGRLQLIETTNGVLVEIGPNLALADKTSVAYEKMLVEEPDSGQRDGIRRAHRNFLRELVYLSYTYDRLSDAERWYQYLKKVYPDAVPPNQTAEEYALNRLIDTLKDLNNEHTRIVIEGLVRQFYSALALDNDDRAAGLERMANYIWTYYTSRAGTGQRLRLPSMQQFKQDVLGQWLDPQTGLDPLLVRRLCTKLSIPFPTNSPPAQPKPPIQPKPQPAAPPR